MKFDFCIGNPPYQESIEATSDKPVYNEFMDAAYEVADKVELITPARFLFNAGKTPKVWNKKMLSDPNLKVLYYEHDSGKVFANTAINGGVVVTYRDATQTSEPIGVFIIYDELNTIVEKIGRKTAECLSKWVNAEDYKFSDLMHKENTQIREALSVGHAYDITSNIFEKLEGIVLFEKKPNDSYDYVVIMGRKASRRTSLWIRKNYIAGPENLSKYKVFLSEADGAAGRLGHPIPARILGKAEVAAPEVGFTQTFITIGAFDSEYEAAALAKYIKTRFLRVLVGAYKVTQHNKKQVWESVPIQNFTEQSDIDWSASVSAIDQQLYKKYGLTGEEINFIETYVKEMA